MQRKFRLGCYFDMYSDNRADWVQEAAFNKQYNVEFLELMLEYPVSVAHFDQRAAAHFKEIVSPTPITVHGPTLNVSLCAGSKRAAEAAQLDLIDGLKACKWLGSPLYTLHGGEFPFFLALNGTDAATEFIKNIRPVFDYATENGIVICIENLKGEKIFPKYFDDLDRIFDAYPALQLAYDVRHFCVNRIDVLEAYERYRNRTPSIQYRDDCGLTDDALRAFLKRLLMDDWAGNFIIEDPALNVADKAGKAMLDAGHKRVTRLLQELETEI